MSLATETKAEPRSESASRLSRGFDAFASFTRDADILRFPNVNHPISNFVVIGLSLALGAYVGLTASLGWIPGVIPTPESVSLATGFGIGGAWIGGSLLAVGIDRAIEKVQSKRSRRIPA